VHTLHYMSYGFVHGTNNDLEADTLLNSKK